MPATLEPPPEVKTSESIAPKIPTPAPASGPQADDDDPFRELDATLKAIAEPRPAPETKKPEAKPEPKVETKPPAKDAPKEAPKEGGGGPKELRQELERTKGEVKAKSEAIAALETRIAEAEAKGKDTTALAERLATREKELETAQAELRAAKAEVSEEFKSKWDKPFEDAAEYAQHEIDTLSVGEWKKDEITGEKTWQKTRKADWKGDFGRLYALAKENPEEAYERVEWMFGKSAPLVWRHIENLKQLDFNRGVALAREKAQWKEKANARDAEAVKQREAYDAAVAKRRAEVLQEHADWYGESAEDAEGNKLLAEGRRLVMERPKTFAQAVNLAVRNQLNAESAPRERHRNQLLRQEITGYKTQIEELKAQIEELKDGKPGPGTRTTTPSPASTSDDDMADLDKIKFS